MSQGVECYSCLPKTAWPPTSYIVNFPKKTFNWVKLTVTQGKGENVGLSEFEVYLI